MWKTIMSRKLSEEDTDKKKETLKKHTEVLETVLAVLEDTEKVESIMEEYDKKK